MLVGSEDPTAANLSDARAQLEMRERLLGRDEIRAILRRLVPLAEHPQELGDRARALSEALEGHLTALAIEDQVRWQRDNPDAPLMVSYVASTSAGRTPTRERGRRRSERMTELVVESLILKAEGESAGVADDWVADWAQRKPGIRVLRKRARDDARRLDTEL